MSLPPPRASVDVQAMSPSARERGESASSAVQRWCNQAQDPNAAVVLARRAETLRNAWRPEIASRLDLLEQRVRGRRVLDVGCVAHDLERIDRVNWLHARLAASAARFIGVDVLQAGVERMASLGYQAICHDLGDGPGPLAAEGPFDVIVAGELIEHVEDLGMLFRSAEHLLAPEGELILTTPNPWAPARVRAGQRGIVWENVDHVAFAFPSGVAELAERHGLQLAEAAVTAPRPIVARGRILRKRPFGRPWIALDDRWLFNQGCFARAPSGEPCIPLK